MFFNSNKVVTVPAMSDMEFESVRNQYKYVTTQGEWGLSNSNSGLEGFSNGVDALADFSIDLFAVFAEPILKFLMVLSFPVASIITVCSFFMIMFGMKEKAASTLMWCGIGYTLIQCSPLLLELYKIIGQNLS